MVGRRARHSAYVAGRFLTQMVATPAGAPPPQLVYALVFLIPIVLHRPPPRV
jgi:hypothetical protein